MAAITDVAITMLEELQKLPQWVCWCYEETKEGKRTKVPYNARKGYKASTTDPKTWSTYELALKGLANIQTRDGRPFDGIGFVFNDDYTGVDLDHCIQADGTIDEWAQAYLDRIKTYAELSPSETGIHILARGVLPETTNAKGERGRYGRKVKLPGKRDKDAAIEMYCQGRFFTITGKHLSDTPGRIEDCQEAITDVFNTVLQMDQKEPIPAKQPSPAPGPDDLTDEALIEKAMHAENGTRFAALWGGDISGNGNDHSAADQALCNLLAFWTGKDPSRMDRLFKQSGLYRGDKWDRNARSGETYGEGTITRAIAHCSEVYTGAAPEKLLYLTDLGNAERFARRYKDTVRWCEAWKSWMVFNGKCWEQDKTGRVDRLAKIVVRSIYAETRAIDDQDQQKRILKHATASESSRAIRALLDRAKSELPATTDQFNKQLFLLNCSNGTVDLRTGVLYPHSPQDMLTRCLKTAYHSHAAATLWHQFIKKIFADDESLIGFVHKGMGMSLSGEIREQRWFLCHGDGSNGKSTLLETARAILEEYGLAADIKSFLVRKNDPGYDKAEFYGKRMITASEIPPKSRLDEAFIKKVTGGEDMRAARKYENEFQFTPECTIWLSVNHLPIVKDASKGMWRRVCCIPFTVTIPDTEVDPELPQKLLKEEAEGILAWLVAGCVQWYQDGRLTVPEVVKKATLDYRENQDTIARFLKEECDVKEDGNTFSSDLKARYEQWCEQKQEKPDVDELKAALHRLGLHSHRSTGGKWRYDGIELKKFEEPSEKSDGSDGSDGQVGKVSESENGKNQNQESENNPANKSLVQSASLPSLPSLSKSPSVFNASENPASHADSNETNIPEEARILYVKLKSAFNERRSVLYQGEYMPRDDYFKQLQHQLSKPSSSDEYQHALYEIQRQLKKLEVAL
jgi:putative DNA primase/helicase